MNYLILASENTSLGHTLVTLIAFILLLLIVKKYAWGPLMEILIKRETIVKNDLESAAKAKKDSFEMNKEAQIKLKDARAEATQIILQAKKQALQIQDNMLKEAKDEVVRMQEAAQKDIEMERRRMLNDMKNELTDISIEIAEKIVQREINNDDYARLVEDFIKGMDEL
ncbi:F0F1 ATP synthase subunit B [Vaginisenegalia massiliensis]|uniref:F0F1 ATP synthase subunit B n=1 Tax=Vaginisenegalia massiliensis TaxID=2058294 RepID=UPI000F54BE74|nr:F0F1 ATP synthase subunit B [Vaginisenegalia massiliensis]